MSNNSNHLATLTQASASSIPICVAKKKRKKRRKDEKTSPLFCEEMLNPNFYLYKKERDHQKNTCITNFSRVDTSERKRYKLLQYNAGGNCIEEGFLQVHGGEGKKEREGRDTEHSASHRCSGRRCSKIESRPMSKFELAFPL